MIFFKEVIKHINTRILLSSVTVLVAAAVIIGATFAFFSDTESSLDNTFVGGELDLQVDNESYYNGVLNAGTTWGLNQLTDQLFFDFTDVKPSDLGEDTISFHAANNYWLCAETTLTENSDNTCTTPEIADDPTCDASPTATSSGELAQEINFVFWGDDGDNVLETDEQVFLEGTAEDVLDQDVITLADSVTNNLDGPDGLPATGGAQLYVGKAWCFGTLTKTPVAAGLGANPTVDGGVTCDGSLLDNATQTDRVLADIKFTAVQSRNNPGFICGGPSITPTISVSPTPIPPTPTPIPPVISCATADIQFASSAPFEDQGLRKNGTPVTADRSVLSHMFGPPQTAGNPSDTVTPNSFFALGFANIGISTATASVVLGFTEPFYNDGTVAPDLLVYEVTGGTYPDEKVKIEASKDGFTWTLLAAAAIRDEEVDLGPLDFANFIRLTDVNNPALFTDAIADGYDVDALKTYCKAEKAAPTPGN